MNWEELTGDQFPEAAAAVQGVCLLPLACIERHAHHLPLGTDMFIARELCRRTAALEPAIVFPDVIFTQILEARHYPGTIALQPDTFINLLENIFEEITRNGLAKIVVVNAHGGNSPLLQFLAQIQLAQPRDYVLYIADHIPLLPEDEANVSAQWETKVDGHAGEIETSLISAIHPELVHMERIPSEPEGMPLERLNNLSQRGIYTGIWWYASHPTHYRGDAHPATAEKGQNFFDAMARSLAATIQIIKKDDVTKRLQDEFFAASERS
jgi:creatinine amidohydrolase